ncbi:MAG TPA: hypothetical protein VGM56_25250 [Byssovorax sp.]
MIRGARAHGTTSSAAAAAQAALDAGGTAVDAVVAGYFVVAGESPVGLLAPAALLVAGPAAGARLFDGRAAQPGRGGSRPRGVGPDDAAPIAASAAAPRAPAMIALAHAQRGKLGLRELSRAGVEAARAAGAAARGALLSRFGQAGVTALAADAVLEALLDAAGTAAGGALTRDDVTEATPEDTSAIEVTLDGGRAVVLPAAFERGAAADPPRLIAIVAVDGKGVAAALALDVAPGVLAPSLEVSLPARAVIARRGVPRLAPGTPLAMHAPLAIVVGRAITIALALPGASTLGDAGLGVLLSGQTAEDALADVVRRSGAARSLGVARVGSDARVLT